MGVLGKFRSKLEEKKAELGLSSGYSRQQRQQYHYPDQSVSSFSRPGPASPLGEVPPGFPMGGQARQPTLPRPEIPPRPTPTGAVSPHLEKPPEEEATPPASPIAVPDGFRPVSPFPDRQPDTSDADEQEEDELTADEVWDGIPSGDIVVGPDGTRDPLGGQKTGHERDLHCTPTREDGVPRAVLGLYYPEWRVYLDRPPSKMREDLATHVYYAFAVPLANGYLWYMDYYAATQKGCDGTHGCLNAMRRLRWKYPHLKLILSCGGGIGSKNFKYIAASSWKRVRFAKSVRYWLRKYQLNGVDIDWEFPDNSWHGANYIRLLRTLRAYLPRPYYQITTALPAGEWVLKNIDVATASWYLDYLNLMGYDLAGPWSPTSGHHAELHAPPADPSAPSCDKAVDYLVARGFPRWKIVLGIPVYSQYFPGAWGPNQSFDNSKAGQVEYRDINYWWRRYAKVDSGVAAAWYVDGTSKGFMSFDTPDTVKLKCNYVKSQGLAGIFFWHGVGDVWGSLSLVDVGYRALNG